MTASASLALAALFGIHMPSLHAPWPHAAEVSRVEGWTLKARLDRFSGERSCTLSRGRIDYQRQALVFHMAAGANTVAARYRIDGAAPVPARADEAELAGLGFALHNDDLDNPSGGLVRIPVHRLTSAGEVQIEAAPGRTPVKFKIGGLSAALQAAHGAGCLETDFKPAFGPRG